MASARSVDSDPKTDQAPQGPVPRPGPEGASDRAKDTEVDAVRIGFDMLAVQSPHHGHRGIGRYSAHLVKSMLRATGDHEFVLYVHEELPDDRVPVSPRPRVRRIGPRWDRGESLSPIMDRLARTNPDSLDVLVVLSPFERWAHYSPPARPEGGLKLAAVVYDLIPFLFQDEWSIDPVLMRHFRALEELSRYDVLLAISGATRNDCLSLLKLPPDRVVDVGSASDPSFFVPDPDRDSPGGAEVTGDLEALGITRPFVLNVGGLDERKNTWRLIDAFAALPEGVRSAYQLVLTFSIGDWWRWQVLHYAEQRGLGGSVVVTGEVSDEVLRLLYQRCEVFAFPSVYEGFGLPILEAMHCGAAVVAGNNSSQIEVVGDAGLLADVTDTQDITAKIGRLLADEPLRRSLRGRAIERASTFDWGRTATRTLDALARVVGPVTAPRLRVDGGHKRKPTIAFFSPFPPRKSGISDYSASLLVELEKTYRIDLYHEAGYVPEPSLASAAFASHDHRLFPRLATAKDYHSVVYQMGNSRYHSFMYETMLRYPGLVTLHDFCLAGFHFNHGRSTGRGLDFIRDELFRWYPESRDEIAAAVARWSEQPGDIARECAERGWYLNRHVVDAAASVVVHSPWCRDQFESSSPRHARKVVVIPLGIHSRRVTDEQRGALRARFGLPEDAVVVASFGFVHPEKMSPQALDAFARVVVDHPRALFVFVGEEVDGGEVREHAASLGLSNRVRFLGRQPADAFADWMAVTDVGVNLRLPPTNGETSAALLSLMASGVATIVTDVATFADFPDSLVRKVRCDAEGSERLYRELYGLVANGAHREATGRAAWEHVVKFNEWPRVAELYVGAIEETHRALRARAAGGRAGFAFAATA